MNKAYVGDRTIDGIVVTVDGKPLDEHTGSKCYTRNGFEWSYEGPEPSQLAYAILVDHLGDTAQAERLEEDRHRAIPSHARARAEAPRSSAAPTPRGSPPLPPDHVYDNRRFDTWNL